MRAYTIGPGGKSITCHTCGFTSHNANDVANFYCGNCHTFFEDRAPTPDPAQIAPLVDRIRKVLRGHPPDIQGGAIADMLSIFIVGHHPGLRESVLQNIVQTARDLIEPNEHIIFPHGLPPDWKTQ